MLEQLPESLLNCVVNASGGVLVFRSKWNALRGCQRPHAWKRALCDLLLSDLSMVNGTLRTRLPDRSVACATATVLALVNVNRDSVQNPQLQIVPAHWKGIRPDCNVVVHHRLRRYSTQAVAVTSTKTRGKCCGEQAIAFTLFLRSFNLQLRGLKAVVAVSPSAQTAEKIRPDACVSRALPRCAGAT